MMIFQLSHVFLVVFIIAEYRCLGDDGQQDFYPDLGCEHTEAFKNSYLVCEIERVTGEEKENFFDPDYYIGNETMALRWFNGKYCIKIYILDVLALVGTDDPTYPESKDGYGRSVYDPKPSDPKDIKLVFPRPIRIKSAFWDFVAADDCQRSKLIEDMKDPKTTDICARAESVVKGVVECGEAMKEDSDNYGANCVEWNKTADCVEKVLKDAKLCDMIEKKTEYESYIRETIVAFSKAHESYKEERFEMDENRG